MQFHIQVKCEFIVKKLHRMRAMRDMTLHMTLSEPQRGADPTPQKYICIMDMSLPGQIIKSKKKLKLKISV